MLASVWLIGFGVQIYAFVHVSKYTVFVDILLGFLLPVAWLLNLWLQILLYWNHRGGRLFDILILLINKVQFFLSFLNL